MPWRRPLRSPGRRRRVTLLSRGAACTTLLLRRRCAVALLSQAPCAIRLPTIFTVLRHFPAVFFYAYTLPYMRMVNSACAPTVAHALQLSIGLRSLPCNTSEIKDGSAGVMLGQLAVVPVFSGISALVQCGQQPDLRRAMDGENAASGAGLRTSTKQLWRRISTRRVLAPTSAAAGCPVVHAPKWCQAARTRVHRGHHQLAAAPGSLGRAAGPPAGPPPSRP